MSIKGLLKKMKIQHGKNQSKSANSEDSYTVFFARINTNLCLSG